MEKCIGCELCAGVCPAKCIYVRGADNDPENPTSPGERYGFVYEINYLRCIHCDLCVEACPTEAITEIEAVRVLVHEPQDAIYTKTELLVGDDGKPQQLPWEDWREGEDLTPAAGCGPRRRRVTPTSSGEVGWSGELGYGVRARARRRSPTRHDRSTARRTDAVTAGNERRVRSGVADGAVRVRRRLADGARRGRRGGRAPATRSTPRSASCSRCSAWPCTSSRRRPTSSPPCRSSSTPARSSCCSCS